MGDTSGRPSPLETIDTLHASEKTVRKGDTTYLVELLELFDEEKHEAEGNNSLGVQKLIKDYKKVFQLPQR